MAPRLATQQGKDQSSKSTTTWDAYNLSELHERISTLATAVGWPQ
jgi:hypothetical protein